MTKHATVSCMFIFISLTTDTRMFTFITGTITNKSDVLTSWLFYNDMKARQMKPFTPGWTRNLLVEKYFECNA